MAEYRCEYLGVSGRREWRTIEAVSETSAASRLVAEGATPLAIRTGPLTIQERLRQPVRLTGRPGVAEQALLLTQLAVLIRSGLPVDRSLDLLRDQSPSRTRREALAAMLEDVRGGSGLAAAMRRRGLFPAYVVGVIAAAEMTGRLAEALTSVSERVTALAATRRQLITSLTYPVAVLAATVLALGLVLTVVIPQFEPSFAGNEERLPGLTVAVLAASQAVREHGSLLLLMGLGGHCRSRLLAALGRGKPVRLAPSPASAGHGPAAAVSCRPVHRDAFGPAVQRHHAGAGTAALRGRDRKPELASCDRKGRAACARRHELFTSTCGDRFRSADGGQAVGSRRENRPACRHMLACA